MRDKSTTQRRLAGSAIDIERLLYRAGFDDDEAEAICATGGPVPVLVNRELIERASFRIDDLRAMAAAYAIPLAILPRG